MTPIDQLVARSGDLKAELLTFSRSKAFARALNEDLGKTFKGSQPNQQDLIGFFDNFIMQRRFSDGRTLVERFVRARGDLPRAERDMLLGWMNVVEGVFEIDRIDGDVLVTVNLMDDLTYRVRSNLGLSTMPQLQPQSFVVTRIVPVLDEWILSGLSSIIPAESAATALTVAAKMASEHPHLVFRNPERLEAAWDMQRKDRADFIEFFGSDFRVLTGPECVEQMRDFRSHQHGGAAAAVWRDLPFEDEASIGLIYDEEYGLGFFADFNLFQEAFEDSESVVKPHCADNVKHYLRDTSISPVPFRRCAELWPEAADRVFAHILGRPKFSWKTDGEAMLRASKPEYFDGPTTPQFTMVSDRIAAHIKSNGIP